MLRTRILANSILLRMKQLIAMTLVVLVLVSPVVAGLNISSANGIVATGAEDGGHPDDAVRRFPAVAADDGIRATQSAHP